MIFALRAMDSQRLSQPARPESEDERGVGAALSYVRGEPTLLILVMMAVVGTLAFNYQVLLPLLGRFTFDGGASAYTALAVAMAIGSVAGALATGARGRVTEGLLVGSAAAFGAAALLAAAAPSLPWRWPRSCRSEQSASRLLPASTRPSSSRRARRCAAG